MHCIVNQSVWLYASIRQIKCLSVCLNARPPVRLSIARPSIARLSVWWCNLRIVNIAHDITSSQVGVLLCKMTSENWEMVHVGKLLQMGIVGFFLKNQAFVNMCHYLLAIFFNFRSSIPSVYLIAKNNKLIGYLAKAEKHSSGYLLPKIKTKFYQKTPVKILNTS